MKEMRVFVITELCLSQYIFRVRRVRTQCLSKQCLQDEVTSLTRTSRAMLFKRKSISLEVMNPFYMEYIFYPVGSALPSDIKMKMSCCVDRVAAG